MSSLFMSFLNSNASKSSVELYLHDLQLYKYYPVENISLVELETICIQRAKVLLYVEKIHKQAGSKQTAHQCKAHLINTLKENGYISFANIIKGASKEFGSDAKVADKILQLRKQDHISHYMLRAAFASHNKRRWFHLQELRLFYWRLYTLTIEEMKEFLHINELKTLDIFEEDKKDLEKYIEANNLPNEMTFYKVPFQLLIDSVAIHKILFKCGMAFVPEKEIFEIIIGFFRENLDLGLASIPMIAEEAATDIRIKNIFDALIECVTSKKPAMQENNGPSLAELDEESKISYPLCMRIIHETLRKNCHLVYGERIQYSLFLKSIGVSLNDALELWKQEFTKIIDATKFEKEYGYRLRHIYGLEGSRKEYNCYECLQIINFNVKSTETHGCPFKHLTHLSLRKKLSDYKISPIDIEDIVQLSSSGYYQAACKKYNEITHNCSVEEIFDSPVDYFNESRKKRWQLKIAQNNNNKNL